MKHDYVTEILIYCKQPRTLTAIKEEFKLNNEKLKHYVDNMESSGYLEVKCFYHRTIKGNGKLIRKQISITEKGREALRVSGKNDIR